MVSRLANFATKHRSSVVITTILLAALAIGWNASLNNPFSVQTGDNLSSKSVVAKKILHDQFHTLQENVIFVFTAKSGTIATRNPDGTFTENPEVKAAQQRIFDDIANLPNYRESYSFWTLTGNFSKQSFLCCSANNQTQALGFAVVDDSDENVGQEVNQILRADATPLLKVQFGGEAAIEPQFAKTIINNIVDSLIWVVPLFLILLLLVFRSVVAALVPAFMAIFVTSWSLLVMAAVGHYTSISAFIFILIAVLGVCLSIYMSLYLIRQFRSEESEKDANAAAVATMQKQAQVVVYGCGTALALSLVLLVFPQSFMHSFAINGAVISALALLFSLFTMPALLGSLGSGIDRYSIPEFKFISKFWTRLCMLVNKLLVPLAIVGLLLLVIAAVPLHNVHFGIGSQSNLDASASSRRAMEAFDKFSAGQQIAADVIFPNLKDPDKSLDQILRYKDKLLKIHEVQAVVTPVQTYIANGSTDSGDPTYKTAHAIRLQVVAIGDPLGYDAEDFVRQIRAVKTPLPALIGGASTRLTDNKANMKDRIPMALGFASLILFVTFFLLSRSWWKSILYILLLALPLLAASGIAVESFQNGHVFTTTPNVIDYNVYTLVVCISVVLLMVAQVVQVTNRKSRFEMIEQSGSKILAPVLLSVVVLLPFAVTHVSFIRMFGIGIAAVLLFDAIVMRMLVGPILDGRPQAKA